MENVNEFLFLGGRASLDLVNTLRGRNDHVLGRRDLLTTDGGLRDWMLAASQEADWFTLDLPQSVPTEHELSDAVSLRESVHDLAVGQISQESVSVINRLARAQPVPALAYGRPVETDDQEADGDRFMVTGGTGRTSVTQLLGFVAADAVNLFATVDSVRIKECSQPRCGMIFLDSSRGNRRRWCSMATCGNRAKVKRFDDRARAGTQE
jgi:predicted RNA-binding Zn ribbon-like protein